MGRLLLEIISVVIHFQKKKAKLRYNILGLQSPTVFGWFDCSVGGHIFCFLR